MKDRRHTADNALTAAFVRHPVLFVVALALLVVLAAVNLLRAQATPEDVYRASAVVRGDIAELTERVGGLRVVLEDQQRDVALIGNALGEVQQELQSTRARVAAIETGQTGPPTATR